MRHKVKKVKLGSDKDHTTAIMRNLAMAVIIYEKVKTTAAKAKAVQPFVERLITIAKRENKVHSIREINKLLQHENSSKKIFEVLVEKYKDRTSGYTRLTKLGYRNGDNAPVVQIELV
ncbi:50S ribosomal protein L17 [Candidatus Peregrinibacteria bacterium]|jgi:large subunit ribosomal protein L17|nr:50S ribosomal protein L17 [Candidatus Peregrinibacteria bacterium]MBT7736814.1 50S ribosomal protein L17 [Candidatus Peregrinibacteria bacterium]